MTKPRRTLVVKLGDLEVGQYADCFVQLAEKKRSSTRDGKPFVACRYRDARRTVGAVPIWGDAPLFEECQKWNVGQFFKVRARLHEHEKYGLQLDIEQIRPIEERDRAEGFTELDFLERSRFDSEQMFAELDALAGTIGNRPLRTLVGRLLHDHAVKLLLLPGSVRHYYPFAGGWLEHTLNVTRNCALLAERYIQSFPDLKPPLNRDLVIAGAILHDIGRVRDLEMGPPGQPAQRGVDGELFGHLFLAYDMIRDRARDVPELEAELLDLLLHIIISHLGRDEWGSPKRTRIPEALILHHADQLDARFEMYARRLLKDTTEGPLTERDPILDRVLLKRRAAQSTNTENNQPPAQAAGG